MERPQAWRERRWERTKRRGRSVHRGTGALAMRCTGMTDPIAIDIPHKLGLSGARSRLQGGIGQLADVVPGGSLKSHRWQDDTLYFELEALGQSVQAELEVFEERIHAVVALPPVAALFASSIRGALSQMGTRLLR